MSPPPRFLSFPQKFLRSSRIWREAQSFPIRIQERPPTRPPAIGTSRLNARRPLLTTLMACASAATPQGRPQIGVFSTSERRSIFHDLCGSPLPRRRIGCGFWQADGLKSLGREVSRCEIGWGRRHGPVRKPLHGRHCSLDEPVIEAQVFTSQAENC